MTKVELEETPRFAQVKLAQIEIRGFRGLSDAKLIFDDDSTYLLGENNCGKTSFIFAVAAAIGNYRPTVDDLMKFPDGSSVEKIEIDIELRPLTGDDFDSFESGLLGGNVYRHPELPTQSCWVRTQYQLSREGSSLFGQRMYLQPGREGLEISRASFNARALELIDCEILDASRDLVQELGTRNSRWGRILFDLQIENLPDEGGIENPLSREVLERNLQLLADQMRAASPVLTQLETELDHLARVQSTIGKVAIQPFPPKIEEIMRSVDIILAGLDGNNLPLRYQGMGSRSLASLFVFSALCSMRVGADREVRPHFITLLEEPEAHLHPHAITALLNEIEGLPGQRVITTHSSHLVAEVKPSSLRILRWHGKELSVNMLGIDSLKDTQHFRRFIERPFGEVLFARCLVFGDGASERAGLPILLESALKVSSSSMGVSIIDAESLNNDLIPKLINAARELGIPWIIFCDNDSDGKAALLKIVDPDTNAPMEMSSQHVVVAGSKAIEQMFIDAGYQAEIDAVAQELGETLTDDTQRLGFMRSRKGYIARTIAQLAMANGKPVPPSVILLADKIVSTLAYSKPDGS